MANGQIKVDYESLADLSTKLTTALDTIGRELEDSVVLSAHCGDARLGVKIVSFGQSWNKHRFDIRDTLEWLRDSVDNIQTQLESVDTELAAGLNGGGSSPANAPQPV
jgi:uncharacterized protein YukE